MSALGVVSGIGAVTPVGAGAAQTCASVRAGLSALRRNVPHYYPVPAEPLLEPPEPLAYGVAAGAAAGPSRARRILEMGVAAMRDLVASSGLTRAEASALEVVACLGGADREGLPPVDPARFAAELPRRLGIALARDVRVAAGGPPAVFRALSDAAARLAAGETQGAVVLAIDSLVDEESLRWLDERERIRSARSADGFLPGEAAACFLLERGDAVRSPARTAFATVAGVGAGDEPNPFTGKANSTGRGLCEAIRAATAAWREQPVPWAVCDMNGESFWAYEWGLARARMGATLGETDLWHPADCMGGIGTAAPALAVVLAAGAFAGEYAPADRVLLWCTSDGRERAACALTAPSAAPGTGR